MTRRRITKEQYRKIQEAAWTDSQQFQKILTEYTGITMREYTAHNFYDEYGDWCGNDQDYDLDGILDEACIEVIDDG